MDRVVAWGQLTAEKERLQEEENRRKAVQERSKELIRLQKNRERLMRNMPVKPLVKDRVAVNGGTSPQALSSSSSSSSSSVSPSSPSGEVAKVVSGLRPFKPAAVAAEKAPTSGYIGDIHSPTLRWEQNDENLDLTVYLPVTTWIRQKDQLNCDFTEEGFILYKGAQITENILHKIDVGGKILPRYCGWEWYYANPYQVKINMYKAKDSRNLWINPIITPPGDDEGKI